MGTVVVSSRGYVVVAQPPMYVAPQIRVLEKNLVLDHALLLGRARAFQPPVAS